MTEYAQLWGLSGERVTIAIPLSGRAHSWGPLSEWLDQQENANLLILDTSTDHEWSRFVRGWLASSRFGEIHYVPLPIERVENRSAIDGQNRVETIMARIWSEIRRRIDTDWVLTLEDDVIPPLDAVGRLLASVDGIHCAGVSAAYKQRYGDAWCVWDEAMRTHAGGTGVERVGATGLGCCLLRTDSLRRHPIHVDRTGHYDLAFWSRVRADGEHLLCDWDCVCEHLTE